MKDLHTPIPQPAVSNNLLVDIGPNMLASLESVCPGESVPEQINSLLDQRFALNEAVSAYRDANREARAQLAAVTHERDALLAQRDACASALREMLVDYRECGMDKRQVCEVARAALKTIDSKE
jgi:hypothetical protein